MSARPFASELVDLAAIAEAVGVDYHTVRNKWATSPDWPAHHDRAGLGGAKRWRVEDLPTAFSRRGKVINVRMAVERHLIERQAAAIAATPNVAVATPNVAHIPAPSGEPTEGVRSFPDSAPASAGGGLAGGDGFGALAGGAREYPAVASNLPGAVPGLPGGAAEAAARAAQGAARPASFSDDELIRISDHLATRPARVREEAMRRARICLTVKRWMEAGLAATEAVAQAAREHGVSKGTLARWWWGDKRLPGVAGIENVAAWAGLLAPRWGMQEYEAPMPDAAWRQLLALWLRPEKPSLRMCYRQVQRMAEKHGWRLPSFASVARRIQRLPQPLVVLEREGKEAYERLWPPMRRSVAHLCALEWVNADGHRLDVFVRLPERFGGGIERVHLVAWQDVYSRKILAWRLTPTLNAYSVILSFADLVEQYGVPDHALMDNGREFGAKAVSGGAPWRYRFKTAEDEMTGILPLLGVTIHWATPFHGQAKPIERAFRDLAETISKDPRLAGAYTGNRPDAKPENYGSRAVEWALLEQVVREAIAEHNARTGRRTETAKGASFDAVFAESYSRRVVKRLAPSQRAMLLLASEPVKVRQNGTFEVAGNTYGVDPRLGLSGQRVVARFDPDVLAKPVMVFSLDGRLLGEAAPTVRRFDDQAAAQAHGREQRRAKRAYREYMAALERLADMEMPPAVAAGDVPAPAAVQLVQPMVAAREDETEVEALVAKTDALILEMSRRMAAGGGM
ncbi:MAG: transposase domain-containing protein [Thermomonas haemolytica]